MAKMNVFTYDNLVLYDSLLKNYINEADAKAFKTVAIDGSKLKFYTVEQPVGETAPAFEISLPETDLSGVLKKLTGATEGDVVVANADGTVKDSGVKLADLATAANLKTVSDKVDVINNETTGILATAKKYTDDEIDALTAEGGAIKANTDAIAKLNGDATTEGSVTKAVKDASDAINNKIGTVEEGKTVVEMIEAAKKDSTYDDTTVKANIGDLSTLKTTDKSSLVGAVNEVKDAVDAAKVSVSTETTTEGYLKSYTIKQGETQLAVIDIPKDLVVTAGEVVVDPEGQEAGTYVKLTIANQEAPIYINVKDLVDAYTAQAEATQIQLAISETNEISATIVAGSVGTTELKDAAVTTAKIADANVTAAKLAEDAKNLFEASGAVKTAVEALDADVTSAAVEAGKGVQVQVVEVDGKITEVKVTGNYDEAYDAKGAAQALADGQVKTNKEAIEALQTKVGDGYEAISTEQINALFTTTAE